MSTDGWFPSLPPKHPKPMFRDASTAQAVATWCLVLIGVLGLWLNVYVITRQAPR